MNADVGPCAYAAHEAINDIYDGELAHSLTAADIAQVPGLLRDDQTACSFTSDSIYELTSDVEVPDSASGKPLTAMLGTVTLWATSDVLGLPIESIQTLYDDPGNKQALSQLQSAERLLASDRAEVESEMEAADKVVGTKLPDIDLPGASGPSVNAGLLSRIRERPRWI